ncbi:TRAP transporter small permease subunit [Dehalococcoidia bacterium]|nr:TRAP transporter small permease subunit [Dehalococcoidia bacterium]
MNRFLSIIDNISQWTGKGISVLLILTVLVIGHEVVMRRGFGAPTLWGFETMVYLCGILYVIGGAYTLYRRKHVIKEIIYGRFSPRGKAIADIITFPFFVLFLGMLLWAGWVRFWGAWTIRETAGTLWDPPLYPILATIPLGALLLLLQGLADFIRNLHHAFTGREIG